MSAQTTRGIDSQALSGSSFSTIDVPGVYSTYANGINDAGQIVGYFYVYYDTGAHGFLLSGSSFSTIDVPSASLTYTYAYGINKAGQIVGEFIDTTGWHGFLGSPLPAQEIDYFALGDSTASGHGLHDDGSECRQSTEAYPELVLQHLQTQYDVKKFGFFACSGATTVTVHRQVTRLLNSLSDRPTLISLTVGADDFEWAAFGLQPFALKLCNPSETGFQRWIGMKANTIKRNLITQLKRLLTHDNKKIQIIITDYHNPTNQSGALWKAVNSFLCPSVDVYSRSEFLVHSLNFAVTQAWIGVNRDPRVHLAFFHNSFHGPGGHDHEAPNNTLCGTAPPDIFQTWIQYPGDPESNAFFGTGDCFHPNRAGSRAIADAVIAIIPSLGQ